MPIFFLDLNSSWKYITRAYSEALDFFARGLVKSPIKVVGLSTLPEIYEKMEKGQIVGRYVVDTSK